MDNYTHLKTLSLEDMSHFLCEMIEEEFYKTHGDNEWQCDKCPMQERCQESENGWLNWLKEKKSV